MSRIGISPPGAQAVFLLAALGAETNSFPFVKAAYRRADDGDRDVCSRGAVSRTRDKQHPPDAFLPPPPPPPGFRTGLNTGAVPRALLNHVQGKPRV